jgi:hypothetical protein
VGCGVELAMCAERPRDSDVSTAEILTSKPRKSVELASGIREHDKDIKRGVLMLNEIWDPGAAGRQLRYHRATVH